MFPEICKIGPFTIYSYGAMLAIAFIVASTLAGLSAKRQNINPEMILNFLFLVLVSGIIGARAFYVLQNASDYIKNPLEIIMLQHGGLSWFGGLLLGFFSGLIYLKKKKLAVYKILDLVAPFAALAQAIGRIGCFLNGCCYGKDGIPAQIYSSLALLLIFVILRFLQEKPHKEGEIFFSYLFLYSIKRFIIEFWRADNPVILAGLTLFQITSMAIFFIAILGLARFRKSHS